MVQKNGVYYLKTVQDMGLEKRVQDKREKLMESFRAQKEEKKSTHALTYSPNTETRGSREEYVRATSTETRRRREEIEDVVDRVQTSQVSNGLYSSPTLERQSSSRDNREFNRTPSFRLSQGNYQ